MTISKITVTIYVKRKNQWFVDLNISLMKYLARFAFMEKYHEKMLQYAAWLIMKNIEVGVNG